MKLLASRIWQRLMRGIAGRDADAGPAASAAAHWDRWQAARAGRPPMTDWADHPEVMRLIRERVFDIDADGFVDYLKRRCAMPDGHALSLCCGDGAFERTLLAEGVFAAIDGLDVSPARIEAANAAAGDFAGRLAFRAADINAADFGEARYDAVVAKSALHHLESLERVLDGIARCLRPGGRLLTIDFFGPTRFQWTDRQLREANDFLARRVPQALRRRADGGLHEATRPAVQAMIDLDPSEAVRSSEILPLLRERFDIEIDLALGGTLLNLVLYGEIVNRFEPGDAEHDALVREAFEHERRLIDAGEIDSDFRLIVARPKPPAAG